MAMKMRQSLAQLEQQFEFEMEQDRHRRQHQRKAAMADRADAFAVLPGGFGTGDELFEALTWSQLGLHEKPIGLLNVNAFFDPLLDWLDRMVRECFLRPQHRALVLTAAEPEALLDALAAWRPAEAPGKWLDDAGR